MGFDIGCTSFTWESKDRKHFFGRTYDRFGDLSENRLAAIPAGEEMKDFKTKYGMAGMAVLGLPWPIMVDGINEEGLMGGLLHYPGYAVYGGERGPERRTLHPGFLVNYLLGRCRAISEIPRALSGISLSKEPVFGQEMPVHYLFSDMTGEAVIIEPDAGGVKIHRNTLGVMTNSPDYLWHKTNLKNYRLEDVGLPGDYSSPSRFVRVAVVKELAVKGEDELDAVSRMFHCFSVVDTPEGIRREKDSKLFQQTLAISVLCAESGTYYFSTAKNRRITALRLKEVLNGRKGIQYFSVSEKEDVRYLKGSRI